MNNLHEGNLVNPRLIAIFFLGFASGLPLVLTGSTLQAWFTSAQINLSTIGALSLLGLPYTLKFLWAPLMDHCSIPWLGRRSGWMLVTQSGLVVLLLLLSFMQPSQMTYLMICLAFGVSFFSASQDIAIDAYRTQILKPEERGLGSAYFVFTYRAACLVAGGLALIFAERIGWRLTYQLMALLIILSMIVSWLAPKADEPVEVKKSIFATTLTAIEDIWQREKILLILLFLILYKFGDALVLQLMVNFLLHTLNFSLTEVGLAYKGVGFAATVSGAFLGGLLLVRWNIYRALLVFGLAQAISNFMFVILAMVGKNYMLMLSAIFIENFCGGLSTAALFAFLMTLCDKQFAATQFALFSAVTSLGRVLLGPVAALMVSQYGWVHFYFYAFLISFLGLFVLYFIKQEVVGYASATAEI